MRLRSKWSIILFSCLVALLTTGFANVQTTSAQSQQPSQLIARRGDPVGIVYFRCEVVNNVCQPRGGIYYVHNGVARENLTEGEAVSEINHVGQWPANSFATPVPEHLYICGLTRARLAALGLGTTTCTGSTVNTWRPWARVRTINYANRGAPIAFEVNFSRNDPHNGAFRSFAFLNNPASFTTNVNTAISEIRAHPNRTGVLHYTHVVNVVETNLPGRQATNPNFFAVNNASVTGIIRIARQHG